MVSERVRTEQIIVEKKEKERGKSCLERGREKGRKNDRKRRGKEKREGNEKAV